LKNIDALIFKIMFWTAPVPSAVVSPYDAIIKST